MAQFAKKSWFRPIVTLIAASTVISCSMKKKDGNGLSVQLIPGQRAIAPSEFGGKHLLSRALAAFTSMTGFSTMSGIDGLNSLNCFAVNVRGGTIDTERMCDSFDLGILDGPYEGIGTTFSPTVPLGGSLTFEALGSAATSCPDLAAGGFDGGASFFKLGNVTIDSDQIRSVVSIPVKFDPTDNFSCGNGPYDIFDEPFNYPNGNLSNASSNGNWLDPPAGASGLLIAGNMVSFSGAGGGFTMMNSLNATLDTMPYTKYSMDVTMTNGPLAPVKFYLGQIDSNASTPSTGAVCSLAYVFPTTGAITLIVQDGSGTVINSVAGNQTPSTSLVVNFSCEVQNDGAGNLTVRASITGTANYTVQGSIKPPASTGAIVFIKTLDPGGGSAYTLDNYLIQQANSFQF